MAVPTGYDIAMHHPAVNNGVAVGFLLDMDDPSPLVEEQQLVGDIAVATNGDLSAVHYGLGPLRYRLRLQLAGAMLGRGYRPVEDAPVDRRAALLAFAAQPAGLVLQLPAGERPVLFVEQLRFVSGPHIDGYLAVVNLIDIT